MISIFKNCTFNILLSILRDAIKKFEISVMFKKIDTFIQQGWIKFIKSESKDLYFITIYIYIYIYIYIK